MMKKSTALVLPLVFAAATIVGQWIAPHPEEQKKSAEAFSNKAATSSKASSSEWIDLPRRGETARKSPRSAEPGSIDAWLIPTDGEPAFTHACSEHREQGEAYRKYRHLSDDELIDSLPESYARMARNYRRDLSTYDPNKMRVLCWGPGTPASVVEAFRRLEVEAGLSRGGAHTAATQFEISNHWEVTATDGPGNLEQGLPVTLTWSLPPDGTLAPDLFDDFGASDFRSWLSGLMGGDSSGDPRQQPWFRTLELAFELMEEQSGITFVYEPNDDGIDYDISNVGELGVRGDLRIAGRTIDGDSGVLAFANFPDYGDMVFDTDDNFYAELAAKPQILVQILAHEIGHSIGLYHVCPISETKLMEPFYTEAFLGPQFDDNYTLNRLYGDREERTEFARDNDSPADASSITVGPTVQTIDWLSIDDDADVDYFKFSSPLGRKISFRIAPPTLLGGGYLEGPQDAACDTGDPFNPTFQLNLGLTLLDTDGVTVLAAATSQPIGQPELILDYEITTGGDYFVRVEGFGQDTAQTYLLQYFDEFADTSPGLAIESIEITDESNLPNNGAADPGETVRMSVVVTNAGFADATSVEGELTGPAGFNGFETMETVPLISVGESHTFEFVFSQDGSCGETVPLQLGLTASGGLDFSDALPLHLGEETTATLIGTDFEGSDDLPTGWTSTATGAGSGWVVTSNSKLVDTGSRALAADSVSSVSESILTSPETTMQADTQMVFRHNFQLETGYDGGVLEYSIGGGAWTDLLVGVPGGTVILEGEYNESILNNEDYLSPLAGRPAWSGTSNYGYITTRIEIPAFLEGFDVRFRWILGDDITNGLSGWRLDNVDVNIPDAVCTDFTPALSITTDDTEVIEGGADAIGKLMTPLPLSQPVNVTLNISGDAEAADLTSTLSLTLPAGDTEVTFPITAVDDGSFEGTEQLVLTIPSSTPGFEPVAPESFSLSIIDGVSGYSAWATGGDPFDGDANGDGVQDGIAFLLGAANPGTDASGLLPTASESGGDLILEFSCLPIAGRGASILNLQHSSDLGIGDPWTGVNVPDASSGPTNGVTFVVTPGAGGLNDVVATIDASEGSGTRLFGRLVGTE